MLFHISLYLALTICLAGLLWRAWRWLSIDIGPEPPGRPLGRLTAAARATAARLLSPALVKGLGALIATVLLQLHLLKAHPLRWLMHMLIFWGFLLLLLFHAFDETLTLSLFPDYVSTLNPFFFLRNLLGVLVVAGLLIALGRRLLVAAQKRVSGPSDILPLLLLSAIMLSGFMLEATQIVSEALFDEMVADYHGDEDPEEVAALRAVWSRDYYVRFDPPATVTDELLAAGAELNEESCVYCHSRPTAAFASWSLAMLAGPAIPALNRVRADVWLWHLHYLLCFVGLALLPFTKFLHLVTTPLTLVLRAVDAPAAAGGGSATTADPDTAVLNRKTRRALALDGCTHCGACSRHCSVAPSYAVIANPLILPSEKLLRLRQTTRQRLPQDDGYRFSEGSFICTECGRCTAVCPSGLDLHDLWRAGKLDLADRRRPDLHARVVQTPPELLLEALAADPLDTPEPAAGAAPPAWADSSTGLSDDPATFQMCVQCAVCSSVCPVVEAASDPDRDPEIGPHLVTNLLRLNQPALAQASGMVWSCVTCYQCQEHCPQHIRVADLLYELRNRAWDRLKHSSAETWQQADGGRTSKEVGR